jgi:hypothetical protein
MSMPAIRLLLQGCRRAPNALCPRQSPAGLSTFAPRGRGHLHDEDFVIYGAVHRAPRACLIWRQRGEIGEIEASDFPHSARGRTYLRIEPHEPERLATDAAKSLLRRHRNALYLRDVKISLAGQGFNIGEIVAAVGKAYSGWPEWHPRFSQYRSYFKAVSVTPLRSMPVPRPGQPGRPPR